MDKEHRNVAIRLDQLRSLASEKSGVSKERTQLQVSNSRAQQMRQYISS